MLTSHEERNHHVGDLVVRDLDAVLVGRVHQMLHDIEFGVLFGVGVAFVDGVHVDLGNGALSMITSAVPGERSPVKSEVDGAESHVEVVVEGGEGFIELGADGTALEGVRSSKDGDFGHFLGDINNARVSLEVGVALEVGCDFVRDDGHVGSEGFGGQGNFHELFLLHELGVGAVIDNIASEDGSGQNSVDLFGIDVLELAVENEVVSGRANSDSRLLAEEDKGEDITML